MTEAEWLAATNANPLLINYVSERSDRKVHLFTLGCVRRIFHLMPAELRELVRAFLQAAEDHQDGCLPEDAVHRAHEQLFNATHPKYLSEEAVLASLEAGRNPSPNRVIQCYHVAGMAVSAVVSNSVWPLLQEAADAHTHYFMDQAREEECAAQADLLRHIIGNPFRRYPVPGHWADTLVQLAETLYQGTDCTFALHDALRDAGHAELAEHFRKREHPKGCWALDLILGKSYQMPPAAHIPAQHRRQPFDTMVPSYRPFRPSTELTRVIP